MTANGHTTGREPEVFMEFVNFDGRVTGETARALIRVAEASGVTPQEMIQSALRYALGEGLADSLPGGVDVSGDVKVEPMTINAGNGGFHVVTVVADGYGFLVAEDDKGAERARVEVQEESGPADLQRLMAKWDETERTEASTTD